MQALLFRCLTDKEFKEIKIMLQDFSEDQIVYEDNHMMVINKKAGQLVQGDKTGDLSLLELIKDFIKKRSYNFFRN